MKKIVIGMLLLCGCMTTPPQPELTAKEIKFFKQETLKFHCKVSREIDTRYRDKSEDINKDGLYFIFYKDLKCDGVTNDSLQKHSFKIAEYIYANILKDLDYSLPKVAVSYDGTDSGRARRESFWYKRIPKTAK